MEYSYQECLYRSGMIFSSIMSDLNPESSSLLAAVRVYDKDAFRAGAHLTGDRTAGELLKIVERAILERPLPVLQDVVYGLQLAEEFSRSPRFQDEVRRVAGRYNAAAGLELAIHEITLFRACFVQGSRTADNEFGTYRLEPRGRLKIV